MIHWTINCYFFSLSCKWVHAILSCELVYISLICKRVYISLICKWVHVSLSCKWVHVKLSPQVGRSEICIATIFKLYVALGYILNATCVAPHKCSYCEFKSSSSLLLRTPWTVCRNLRMPTCVFLLGSDIVSPLLLYEWKYSLILDILSASHSDMYMYRNKWSEPIKFLFF